MAILVLSSYFACAFLVENQWIWAGGSSLSQVAFKMFVANMVVFSALIPISLFVTMEGIRIAHSVYIREDDEMIS